MTDNQPIRCLTLKAFLNSQEEGEQPIEGPVKILEVVYWYLSNWNSDYSLALAHICRRLRVKTLVFDYTDGTLYEYIDFFSLLRKHVPAITYYPFLPDLKEIEVTYPSSFPPTSFPWNLIHESNVRKLTWHSGKIRHPKLVPDDINSFLLELYNRNTFEHTFRLRELNFSLAWKENPIVPFRLQNWDGFLVYEGNLFIENCLIQNQNGFQKVLNAIITILGLRKRKEFSKYRDVLGMIIKMIWETNGTKIWIDNEHG